MLTSCCAFHLYNCFSEGFKTMYAGRGTREVWGHNYLFQVLISVNVFGVFSSFFLIIGIDCDIISRVLLVLFTGFDLTF